MCPFEPGSEVTVLKCNPGHYFHHECIENWVKEGKNSCPHCREPIQNIDEIRAMMEGGEWEFSNPNSLRSKRSLNSDTDSRRRQIVNLSLKSSINKS